MVLFASDKAKLLGRFKKRDWQSLDELRKLFGRLTQLDVRAPDIAWMLSDGDRMLRAQALEWIRANRVEGVAPLLVRQIRQDPTTGSMLLPIVAQLDDPGLLALIAELQGSRELKDRTLAVDLILAHPIAKLPTQFFALLGHEERDVRYRALTRLATERREGEALDPRVRRTVREMARDKDDRVRIRALTLLAEQTDEETAHLLIERFAEERASNRAQLAPLIERLVAGNHFGAVDKVLELMAHPDDGVRNAAFELALRHARPEEVIRRIILMSQQLLGWMRVRVMNTIREHGHDVLEPVAELLRHPDDAVRHAALLFATNFEDPRFVEPVVGFLKHPNWWYRLMAMDLLGRIGDPRAMRPLIECLSDSEARWSAVEALTRIGTPEALQAIVRLLNDKAKEVRMQVVRSLEHFNDVRALPLLEKSMELLDPELEVREQALAVYRAISTKHEREVDEIRLRERFGYGRTDTPLDKLLAQTRRVGASDLHVTPGDTPFVRRNGELAKASNRAFTADECEQMLLSVLNAQEREQLEREMQVDLCYTVAGVGRYRANVYRQRLGLAGVFRVIPNEVPTFSDTGLPRHLREVAAYHQGLVIVAGKSGSGKSTTLAALVNLLNEQKKDHILTIEDPIEFVHAFKASLVNQRQVQKHTKTFASALRAALREDPDIIVVGELRDQETMSLAMTAAETGHLVIATMHAPTAPKAVERLIEAFPPREQQSVRMALSESLKFVICQSLMPRRDGKGRVAYHEILMITGPVRNLIRDAKDHLIPSIMAISRQHGSQTVDMALEELLSEGLITPEQAYLRAQKKESFANLVSADFLHSGLH